MHTRVAVAVLSFLFAAAFAACNCGPGGGNDGGHDGGAGCPHVVLPSEVPTAYDGDTAGQPNWVDSPRLEWTTAPDDSLLYTTPVAGSYGFRLTSGNGDLNLSIRNLDDSLHAVRGCPAPGQTLTLDGVYEGSSWISLDAGTEVLIWVSTPSWAATPTGAYHLTVGLE